MYPPPLPFLSSPPLPKGNQCADSPVGHPARVHSFTACYCPTPCSLNSHKLSQCLCPVTALCVFTSEEI